MTDELFVKELRILWQNASVEAREDIRNIIEKYYPLERSSLIISYLQETI